MTTQPPEVANSEDQPTSGVTAKIDDKDTEAKPSKPILTVLGNVIKLVASIVPGVGTAIAVGGFIVTHTYIASFTDNLFSYNVTLRQYLAAGSSFVLYLLQKFFNSSDAIRGGLIGLGGLAGFVLIASFFYWIKYRQKNEHLKKKLQFKDYFAHIGNIFVSLSSLWRPWIYTTLILALVISVITGPIMVLSFIVTFHAGN